MTTPFDKHILWIYWKGQAVKEKTIAELVSNVRNSTPNVSGVAIKTSNGASWQGNSDTKKAMEINGVDDIKKWVDELTKNDLETHLWCVVRGEDVVNEVAIVAEACKVAGVKSMLLDVEGGQKYFGGQPASVARDFITQLRDKVGKDFHLGLNFDARGSHPKSIHFDEWLPHVDSLHPMVYHWHFSGGKKEPNAYLDDAFETLKDYKFPIVPMLETYDDPVSQTPVPPHHIKQAGEYAMQKGAVGITYFRYGTATDDHKASLASIDIKLIKPMGDGEDRDDDSPVIVVSNPLIYEVRTAKLNVRSDPTLEARALIPSAQLRQGDRIEVVPNSKTEAEGFVWLRHAQGWSAERSSDGKTIFLDLVPQDAGGATEPLTAEEKERFLVTKKVNIRDKASVKHGTVKGSLLAGDIVVVEGDPIVAEGYIWQKHTQGFSAERSEDGKQLFMVPIGATDPKLPQPAFSFVHLPLVAEKIEWVQYYGNTEFAFNHQSKYGYSQGLHGGIDLGRDSEAQVTAGVHGVLQYSGDKRKFLPNRVDVQVGDYVIVYGHLINPIANTDANHVITPDTVLGQLDVHHSNSERHVHIEVRYKGNLIYNPLWFMPADLRDQFITNFPPTGFFRFYSAGSWNQWLTPLDQPIITLGGQHAGPPQT